MSGGIGSIFSFSTTRLAMDYGRVLIVRTDQITAIGPPFYDADENVIRTVGVVGTFGFTVPDTADNRRALGLVGTEAQR